MLLVLYIIDMVWLILLSYPSGVVGGLLLAHGDYYLPSRWLEKRDGGDSTVCYNITSN
jgi:hypothetical protein